MSYEEYDYYEYSVDGDKIDMREQKIRDLKRELRQVDIAGQQEQILREKHPALDDIWNQYQEMKKLLT